jgi:glycosyltransferase involved in cell wall biosynthesis
MPIHVQSEYSRFNLKREKLFFICSSPTSVSVFLKPHLKILHSFYFLFVFANTKESRFLQEDGLNLAVDFAPIERKIHLIADLKALLWLFRRFRSERPDAVHTLTPKAGLLGMCAAWLARVPVRVHTFTGQVWVTRQGPMRWVLKAADQCIAGLATDVLVDSPSQRRFLIQEGVVSAQGSAVLGEGSICGVNTQRFSPSRPVRQQVRTDLGSTNDALVCLYLGRLNRDKGVLDLAAAFAQVANKHPKAELWVVGPDEDDMFAQMQSLLGMCKQRVRRVGYTNEPERFMQAADLFCLPSYREGFGSSVIEAAACGVPALASRIYGLTDAVVEGQTGWMHEAGNVQDLATQLDALLEAPTQLQIRGEAARANVELVFEQSLITNAMLAFYKARLEAVSAKDTDL